MLHNINIGGVLLGNIDPQMTWKLQNGETSPNFQAERHGIGWWWLWAFDMVEETLVIGNYLDCIVSNRYIFHRRMKPHNPMTCQWKTNARASHSNITIPPASRFATGHWSHAQSTHSCKRIHTTAHSPTPVRDQHARTQQTKWKKLISTQV